MNQQSYTDFEAIISEDNIDNETIDFVKNHSNAYNYSLIHLHQLKDDGFRKNEMLNRSISIAKGECIAFIDGDCIPHKQFVKEYVKHTEPGHILYGRRVMLGEKISTHLLATENLKSLHLLNILRSKSQLVKEALYSPFINLTFKKRGLLGCNWAVLKKDLIAVNGFDEDYIRPGVGEDVDIEWRLKASGLKMKSMKNKAIVYHMYHERSYSEDGVQFNYGLLKEKEKSNHFVCTNGINKG